MSKPTKNKKIRKLMIDLDITGAHLARLAGCTRANVWFVIDGVTATPAIRELIARELGRPISDLWPNDRRRRAA